MTIQEKLPVLKKMLADYLGVPQNLEKVNENNLLNRGYCHYLYQKAFPSTYYKEILQELFKDYVPVKKNWVARYIDQGFWYPTADEFWITHTGEKWFPNEFKDTIQPRIDNLKRTIARLENKPLN